MKQSRTVLAAAFAAFLVAASLPSRADDQEERLKAAASYIETTMASMQIDKIAAASVEQMLSQIKAAQPELGADKILSLRGKATPILVEAMTESVMGLDKTLAEVFTLEELMALQDFYSTPAGQTILQKMPRYVAAIQPALQRALQTALPKILTLLREEGGIKE